MAGSKLKILYIAKFLFERTDETHPAPIGEIAEYLASVGISSERKSLYTDIAALSDMGAGIEFRHGSRGGYFIASRKFELPELRMLIDLVQASPFIPEDKCMELISKLESLTSEYMSKGLRRQVYVRSRVKTPNKAMYYSIDGIHEALNRRKRVEFKYFDWDENGGRVYRREGGAYTVSPAALYVDKHYYLVSYDEDTGFRHYRVDRISDLQVCDESAARLPDGFDIGKYCREIFSMFQGEKETVTLRFKKPLLNPVLDHFGIEALLHSAGEDMYELSSEVEVSPTFLGWVLSFGADMKIVSPPDAAEKLRVLANDALAAYGEK